jgi:hypothetical protein
LHFDKQKVEILGAKQGISLIEASEAANGTSNLQAAQSGNLFVLNILHVSSLKPKI